MWQEGQKEDEEEDLFDDVPESFILCALHQGVNLGGFVFLLLIIRFNFSAKIIRERWKFWSGTVPADVSVS